MYTSVLLGSYLLGSISPAAILARIRGQDLRAGGTKNRGATNTMLLLGKRFAVPVLLLDILKSFLPMRLVSYLLPTCTWLPMASGFCAILGHCFPFYLKFRGGKGLAPFAGVVLAYRPSLFLFLLITGIALLLILNHGVALSYWASGFFAIYVACRESCICTIFSAIACAILILAMHFSNLKKAIQGKDQRIRTYLKTKIYTEKDDKS